jgi:hypothetical protein
MNPNSDLTELLHALNAEGARYLIVGAYAFAIHARPRATKDADIFIEATPENARRVWEALRRFGAPLEELRIEDLQQPDTFFIMGRPPNQIDIITSIDGVEFAAAWENRLPSAYAGEPVSYIGREDLIANKVAAGRPQDLADVAYLRGEDG